MKHRWQSFIETMPGLGFRDAIGDDAAGVLWLAWNLILPSFAIAKIFHWV